MTLDRAGVRLALGLLIPALVVLWWQSQAALGGPRSLAFAPLGQVAAAAGDLAASGQLLDDALATLSRALFGLLAGGALGIALGVALASSATLDRIVGPLFHAVRQVPLLGWLPLVGLWLGNGESAKLLIVALAAFYPSVIATHEGLANVERHLIEVGTLYGLSGPQAFRLIRLPGAAPMILMGLTQALTFAWIAAIGTEILLGSGGGLGAAMASAQARSRMDVILVAIIVTASLGFTLNHLFARLRTHLLRWQAV